jgi:hypothetical protein
MAKAKAFPETIYVQDVVDGDLEYFNTQADPATFAEIGEKNRFAVYRLVETREVSVTINERKVG